jgi:hypothetical protein
METEQSKNKRNELLIRMIGSMDEDTFNKFASFLSSGQKSFDIRIEASIHLIGNEK